MLSYLEEFSVQKTFNDITSVSYKIGLKNHDKQFYRLLRIFHDNLFLYKKKKTKFAAASTFSEIE